METIHYTQEKKEKVKEQVQKPMELDAQARDEDRISARFPVEKMKKEYKNK